MTLRHDIAEAIKNTGGDVDQAAIEICRLLEDRIGLCGNGWFDDDDEMLELLSAED
ncbi:hypothetical protein LXA54_17010 [Erwinia amylovora]|uniref:hypothetical protein n=1 Tax=Erwinia amylovora TaxID=552 RepID=UPI0020BFD73D|nr:hypothetical protein [Erwinia amylovora]MCK8335990.1 hypothetical protein [Erwinia amylovora]